VRARRRGFAAVLLAVTGGVAGVGPVLLATGQPAWAFQAEAQILETDPNHFAYNPNYIEVYVGDRVRWKNNTEAKHTVTSDPGSPASFDSDEIPPTRGPEDGWEKRFNQVGTYNYRCKVHPNMKGVVQVSDPRVTSTTATTAPPPPPSSTAPTTTTTTTAPTTTTTAPATTTTLRPPAGLQPPPVPATAAAPPPARATSSTTTIPSSTTTTTAPPPTTATSVPPSTSPEPEAAVPGTSTSAPPSTDPPTTGTTGNEETTAAGPISRDGGADPATVALVAALIAVGLFGTWTLIRVRPGRV